MAINTSVFSADLSAVIADLPATATWNSQSFPVALSELSEEQTLLIIGDIDRMAFTCVFPTSSFTGLAPTPQKRFPIIQPGASTATNFEIVSANLSPDGISWRLTLKADHRNA